MLKQPITTSVTQKQFNFKFIPDTTKVYYITGRRSLSLPQRSNNVMLYSEPFISKERKDTSNALLAFSNSFTAEARRDAIQSKSLIANLSIETTNLKDMKYFSHIFKLPLIIELNNYCEIGNSDTEYVDIFYYHYKSYSNLPSKN